MLINFKTEPSGKTSSALQSTDFLDRFPTYERQSFLRYPPRDLPELVSQQATRQPFNGLKCELFVLSQD